MRFVCMRLIAAAAGMAILGFAAHPAMAQSDAKSGSPRQQGTEADGTKKVDEFAEAAKLLEGPAGYPECVWLGRRAVSLLWRDDLDTAFRHMELYDRFGCPAAHIQATFRCVVRQGSIDPKATDTLSGRVHGCWINPNSESNSAAAPTITTNR